MGTALTVLVVLAILAGIGSFLGILRAARGWRATSFKKPYRRWDDED